MYATTETDTRASKKFFEKFIIILLLGSLVLSAVLVVVYKDGMERQPEDCAVWELRWMSTDGLTSGKSIATRDYEEALKLRATLEVEFKGKRAYWVVCVTFKEDIPPKFLIPQ